MSPGCPDSLLATDDSKGSKRKRAEAPYTALPPTATAAPTTAPSVAITPQAPPSSHQPPSNTSEAVVPKVQFKIGTAGQNHDKARVGTPKLVDNHGESRSLVGPGRVPNSSFLWAKRPGEETRTGVWQSKEVGEGSVLDDEELYDDVGAINYQTIGNYRKEPLNHSYMDIGNARYLEIGSHKSIASSLGSYDDIRSPNLLQAPTSSRIYLSADNLSLIQYDDIKNNPEEEEEEELHSSALVMATPCMVLEEQLDSLSYVYDDIGRRDEPDGDHRREELCGDLGLYESIAGSLLNLARSKAGSSMEVRGLIMLMT